MGHSANLPCRHCFVAKADLFNPSYDVLLNARRQQHQEAFYHEHGDLKGTELTKKCTETGWRAEVLPLSSLNFDACQQVSQEPMHLVLENICKPLFIGMYQVILTESEQEELSARFHAFKYPRGLLKIPFPLNSKMPERFGMTQVLSLHTLRALTPC